MSDSTRIWHVRTSLLLTSAQHSIQTPMAQSGLRNSPETDVRVESPARRRAAATVVPRGTDISVPLTLTLRMGSAFDNIFFECMETWSDVDCNPFCILRIEAQFLKEPKITGGRFTHGIEVID